MDADLARTLRQIPNYPRGRPLSLTSIRGVSFKREEEIEEARVKGLTVYKV